MSAKHPPPTHSSQPSQSSLPSTSSSTHNSNNSSNNSSGNYNSGGGNTKSREWSTHSKLNRLWKSDVQVPLAKKVKTIQSFYQESPRLEIVSFHRDCYAMIYRLILDVFHHANLTYAQQQQALQAQQLHGNDSANSAASILTSISKQLQLTGNDESPTAALLDIEILKNVLNIFRRLIEDTTSIMRSKWQARSIKNALLALVMHSNKFVIRTRGLQLLLAYIDLFAGQAQSEQTTATAAATSASANPPSTATASANTNVISSATIISELSAVLRDVVDLRPFLFDSGSPSGAASPRQAATVMASDFYEHLTHSLCTSGRNQVFMFMEDPAALTPLGLPQQAQQQQQQQMHSSNSLKEQINCNLHLFDAILNYVLHQSTMHSQQMQQQQAASPSSSSNNNSNNSDTAARAQCAHFLYWFDILKTGIFTYLYPATCQKLGFSNMVLPPSSSTTSSAATTNSAPSSAGAKPPISRQVSLPSSSPSHSPTVPSSSSASSTRCIGFRPLCPVSLHLIVVTWLLKAFQLPIGGSNSTGGSSSHTILNELCNDSSNLTLLLEIFRQSFLLLPHRAPGVLRDILDIYSHWISGEYLTPVIFHTMQYLMKTMMDHVFPAFCTANDQTMSMAQFLQGGGSTDGVEDDSSSLALDDDDLLTDGMITSFPSSLSPAQRSQLRLCSRVISFYTLISREPFVILNENTWEHLIITLLNATNFLVKMAGEEEGASYATAAAVAQQQAAAQAATASGGRRRSVEPAPLPSKAAASAADVKSVTYQLLEPLLECLFDCYLRSCISLPTVTSPTATTGSLLLPPPTTSPSPPPSNSFSRPLDSPASPHTPHTPHTPTTSSTTSSTALMTHEMESKIRGWLYGIHGTTSASSLCVVQIWKRKLLSLTTGLLDTLEKKEKAEKEGDLTRPRSLMHGEMISPASSATAASVLLNPVAYGHRVGSTNAVSNVQQIHAPPSQQRMQEKFVSSSTTTGVNTTATLPIHSSPLFSAQRKHRSSTLSGSKAIATAAAASAGDDLDDGGLPVLRLDSGITTPASAATGAATTVVPTPIASQTSTGSRTASILTPATLTGSAALAATASGRRRSSATAVAPPPSQTTTATFSSSTNTSTQSPSSATTSTTRTHSGGHAVVVTPRASPSASTSTSSTTTNSISPSNKQHTRGHARTQSNISSNNANSNSPSLINSSPTVLRALDLFPESVKIWLHFLRLIGHPSLITAVPVKRAAWKAIIESLLVFIDATARPIVSKKVQIQAQLYAQAQAQAKLGGTAAPPLSSNNLKDLDAATLAAALLPEVSRKYLPQAKTLLYLFAPLLFEACYETAGGSGTMMQAQQQQQRLQQSLSPTSPSSSHLLRNVFSSPPTTLDTSGLRAMSLAALSRIFTTRSSSNSQVSFHIPQVFYTSYLHHLRCGLAAGEAHVAWTILRQARNIFTQEQCLPQVYVVLGEMLRAVQQWSTPKGMKEMVEAQNRELGGGAGAVTAREASNFASSGRRRKKDKMSQDITASLTPSSLPPSSTSNPTSSPRRRSTALSKRGQRNSPALQSQQQHLQQQQNSISAASSDTTPLEVRAACMSLIFSWIALPYVYGEKPIYSLPQLVLPNNNNNQSNNNNNAMNNNTNMLTPLDLSAGTGIIKSLSSPISSLSSSSKSLSSLSSLSSSSSSAYLSSLPRPHLHSRILTSDGSGISTNEFDTASPTSASSSTSFHPRSLPSGETDSLSSSMLVASMLGRDRADAREEELEAIAENAISSGSSTRRQTMSNASGVAATSAMERSDSSSPPPPPPLSMAPPLTSLSESIMKSTNDASVESTTGITQNQSSATNSPTLSAASSRNSPITTLTSSSLTSTVFLPSFSYLPSYSTFSSLKPDLYYLIHRSLKYDSLAEHCSVRLNAQWAGFMMVTQEVQDMKRQVVGGGGDGKEEAVSEKIEASQYITHSLLLLMTLIRPATLPPPSSMSPLHPLPPNNNNNTTSSLPSDLKFFLEATQQQSRTAIELFSALSTWTDRMKDVEWNVGISGGGGGKSDGQSQQQQQQTLEELQSKLFQTQPGCAWPYSLGGGGNTAVVTTTSSDDPTSFPPPSLTPSPSPFSTSHDSHNSTVRSSLVQTVFESICMIGEELLRNLVEIVTPMSPEKGSTVAQQQQQQKQQQQQSSAMVSPASRSGQHPLISPSHRSAASTGTAAGLTGGAVVGRPAAQSVFGFTTPNPYAVIDSNTRGGAGGNTAQQQRTLQAAVANPSSSTTSSTTSLLPSYYNTPLRREYIALYATLLEQLLYCVLEWCLNSSEIGEVLNSTSAVSDDISSSASRLKSRLFKLLDSCQTLGDTTKHHTKVVYFRLLAAEMSSLNNSNNNNMTMNPSSPAHYSSSTMSPSSFASSASFATPSADPWQLPREYLDACVSLQESAGIVQKHLWNRQAQFPVKTCWEEEDEVKEEEGKDDEKGSDVSGLIVSTVTEENDPVVPPPINTALSSSSHLQDLITTQLAIDTSGEVTLKFAACDTQSMLAAAVAEEVRLQQQQQQQQQQADTTATSQSSAPVIHLVYNNTILLSLHERPSIDSATTPTTVRLIVRDMTGKYVYDMNEVMIDQILQSQQQQTGMIKRYNGGNADDLTSSTSCLPPSLSTLLLTSSLTHHSSLRFSHLIREWQSYFPEDDIEGMLREPRFHPHNQNEKQENDHKVAAAADHYNDSDADDEEADDDIVNALLPQLPLSQSALALTRQRSGRTGKDTPSPSLNAFRSSPALRSTSSPRMMGSASPLQFASSSSPRLPPLMMSSSSSGLGLGMNLNNMLPPPILATSFRQPASSLLPVTLEGGGSGGGGDGDDDIFARDDGNSGGVGSDESDDEATASAVAEEEEQAAAQQNVLDGIISPAMAATMNKQSNMTGGGGGGVASSSGSASPSSPLASTLVPSVDITPEFSIQSDRDPLEQLLSYIDTNYSPEDLLTSDVDMLMTGGEYDRNGSLLSPRSSLMHVSSSPPFSPSASSHHNQQGTSSFQYPHNTTTTTNNINNNEEGADSVTFFDMSNVHIDEDTFSEGAMSSIQVRNGAAVPSKAQKLMGIQQQQQSGQPQQSNSPRSPKSAETSPRSANALQKHESTIMLYPSNHPISIANSLAASSASSPSSQRVASTTSTIAVTSPFDRVRALLMRVYINLDTLVESLRPSSVSSTTSLSSSLLVLDDSVKLRRALKLLDANPCRECHKIGVIYVGPAQDSQKAVLSNDSGSMLYEAFLASLGELVSLQTHEGFVGGLDARSTGSTTRYWSSATQEIMWHIVTLMPSKSVESDEQQIHKKCHIGNDHVHVVWSEYERDYRPTTITSQFNDVHIVVYPVRGSDSSLSTSYDKGLYRISIHCKPSVPSFGPLQDGMLLRGGPELGSLIRLTALNANRAIRYSTPGYARPEPTRKKYIEELVKKDQNVQGKNKTQQDVMRNLLMAVMVPQTM